MRQQSGFDATIWDGRWGKDTAKLFKQGTNLVAGSDPHAQFMLIPGRNKDLADAC